MLGAIIGDICGSAYEFTPVHTDDFELLGALDSSYNFTDETVLTVAIAAAYMHQTSYAKALSDYTQAHPQRRYGKWFRHWATSVDLQPYNSYGNGSAMRVSAIGLLAQSEKEVLIEAKKSAEVTHSHPEGIKGAQAVALAIYLAKTGTKKLEIKRRIEEAFGYNLSRGLLEIRKTYRYDITCQGSVPEAIIAFLESTDFESAIKNAILLRGDADTQASIAGAIAEAYYKSIPQYCINIVYRKLSHDLISIVKEFQEQYDALYPKEPVEKKTKEQWFTVHTAQADDPIYQNPQIVIMPSNASIMKSKTSEIDYENETQEQQMERLHNDPNWINELGRWKTPSEESEEEYLEHQAWLEQRKRKSESLK